MQDTREIDLYWHKIRDTVDELVGCLEGVGSDDLDWSPLDDANSLYVLATHTMGNVRHNLLNGLCGLPLSRDRDAEFVVTGGSAVRHRGALERAQGPDFRLPSRACRPASWTAKGTTPATGPSAAALYWSSSPLTLPSTTARPS